MIFIVILGAATGAIIGFRHLKVWALTPLIALTAAGVVANGLAIGLDSRNMMFGLLAAVVCPQIGYLMSFIGSLVAPQQSQSDRESGFTISSREQELLLSNYKTNIHHRAARAKGEAAVQPNPDAANIAAAPFALNQRHPAASSLDAVSC